jgi:hypothetical protein
MTARTIPALALMLLALSAGCSAGNGATATESADGAPSADGPHDSFHVFGPMNTEYEYDCAAQPTELALGFKGKGRGDAVMRTIGCAWPASSPTIEVDVQIQSDTPIQDQTFDLASTPPATIEITSGIGAGSSNESLFASWENNPTPGAGSPLEITTAGTSGTVVVHSFDPTTGSLDVSFQDVFLPEFSPGSGVASGEMAIVSGEVVR